MTAKTEIADYSISTSFGKRRRVKHDRKWTRPQTREDRLRQIEATYRHNDWKESERTANALTLDLEFKETADYTDAELEIITDDLEKYRMIIYED